jgi:septum formation protein
VPDSDQNQSDSKGYQLHLASASPRRWEILQALGLVFTAAAEDVDESRLEGEDPESMAIRLATTKAQAAANNDRHDNVILAADTVVTIGDAVFGKPESREDAVMMLELLSGKGHIVLTGVAVLCQGVVRTTVSRTSVRFREISPDEAAHYWQSGEPCDKAGAYAIQGKGGIFVEAISGSYSGVVGLPIFGTARLLGEAGIFVLGSNGS